MDIFYFILFAAVGLFCMIAAVTDLKWFMDYWVRKSGRSKKNRNVLRVLIGLAGAALILFGTAVLIGFI